MWTWTLRLAVVVGLTAVTVVGIRQLGGVAAQSADTYIREPNRWVPFTAEREIVFSDGAVYKETNYQATNGSIRSVRHAKRYEVDIVNRETGKYYRLVDNQWAAYPANQLRQLGVALAPGTVATVGSDDPRIASVAHLNLPVYEHRSANGTTTLLCPSLNMLVVWATHPDVGIEERVTRVVLGEATVEFAPPKGARVREMARPAGPGGIAELPSVRVRR